MATKELRDNLVNSRFSGLVTAENAWSFASLFVRPEDARARVVESITLVGDHVRRDITIELRGAQEPTPLSPVSGASGPPSAGATAPALASFVPVLRFRKGYLVSNLTITDGEGADMPTLPFGDYTLLAGACIRALLAAAVDTEAVARSLETERSYSEMEGLLLARCVSSAPGGKDIDEVKLQNFLYQLPVRNDEVAETLCSFAAQVGANYAIVATLELPKVGNAILSTSYTEPVPTLVEHERNGFARLKGRLRDYLGLDPTQIVIDVSRAKKSLSYHLKMRAPQGYYVGENAFIDEGVGSVVALEPKRIYQASREYFHAPNPRAQEFAHLYTRGFYHSPVKAPKFIVRFFERPPGALGKAAALAFSTAAVIWLFGATWVTGEAHTTPDPSGSSLGGTDPGAFVFAVPLALWVLSGYGDRKRAYVAALLAQVSLFVSLLLSFLAVVVTLFIESGRLRLNDSWPSVLFVTQPYWIVLLLLSLVNLAWISGAFLIRFWRWKAESLTETSE